MSVIHVPSVVDDPSTRAIAEIIDERFSAIPVAKVLAWHLSSQSVESLRLAGEFFGLNGPEFGGAAPTAEVIQRGVVLRRTRGTSGAQLDVLSRLGYADAHIDEDAFTIADGSITADGEWRAGADRSEAFYQSYVGGYGLFYYADGGVLADGYVYAGGYGLLHRADGSWTADGLSLAGGNGRAFDFADGTSNADGTVRAGVDTYRKVWDVIERWSRPGTEFAVGVRLEGEPTTMFRERP